MAAKSKFPKIEVPARVLSRFDGMPIEQWRQLDNNTKAHLGKQRFLELPGTFDASPALIREWLAEHGIETSRGEWMPVEVAPGLATRWVSTSVTTRCVDALLKREDGAVLGCELKVSGDDGVSGLTVTEERLLRSGLIKLFFVNPVRGLIGEADSVTLLDVPRRVDGIPVGEARVRWLH